VKFSPSKIRAFGECALQAKFKYVDNLPTKTGSSAHWGTSLHHALEHYTNNEDIDEAIQEFIDYYDSITPDYWNRRTSYTAQKDMGKRILEDFADSSKWTDNLPIAAEYKFMVDVGDHQLSGIVDYLDVTRDFSALRIIDYKGLALDTPLPTPTGWTTMGQVEEGDDLIGSNGETCKVLYKSAVHRNPTYVMKFEDGSEIICDHEHRWNVISGREEKAKTLTTKEILESLRSPNGQRQHRIVNAAPLSLPEASLPIHPYVLGYWLGDGKHTSSEITSAEGETWDNISSFGYATGSDTGSNLNSETRTVYGISAELRSLGLRGNKHVPIQYLRSSLQQRLDLLRGMMDSDGNYNKIRKQAVFVNTNKRLADAVFELAASLGFKPSKWSGKYSGFGVSGTQYRIQFTPTASLNPFMLSRKANLVRASHPVTATRRVIKDVIPVDTVETQCIGVDSPDQTYLCGQAMIPTHNSGMRPNLDNLYLNIQFTAYDYASWQKEFWTGYPGQKDKYPGLPNGQGIWEALQDVPRQGIWYDLKKNQEIDVGPRGEKDYARMYRAMEQIARAVEHEVYVPSISGDTCGFCDFQDICPVYFERD
jgi:hypothetical protein